MPYPKGFLESRAVIKPGIFTIIPSEGRVINSIPGFEGCKLTIIASPKHGASFAQYVGSVEAGGKTLVPFVEAPGAETFLFVMDGDGELQVRVGDITEKLKARGYAFATPDTGIEFENTSSESVRVLLYKQRYVPLGNLKPWIVFLRHQQDRREHL